MCPPDSLSLLAQILWSSSSLQSNSAASKGRVFVHCSGFTNLDWREKTDVNRVSWVFLVQLQQVTFSFLNTVDPQNFRLIQLKYLSDD